MSFTLPAPAKINLFLHITSRRADGYHNLQTLFQLLDYGDEITFTLRDDGKIVLESDMADIKPEDNLIYHAARALDSFRTGQQGATITLDKHLPAGGGLGGGSSDAATTLLGLNQLWNLNLPLDQLATIGASLGADVPVFVRGKTAWGEGVGDILQPVETPPCYYLVVCPNCHVSTAEIFADKELTRDAHPITIRAFLKQGGQNHCQPVVEKRYPEVKKARLWLQRFAPTQMTGTGACLFARFDRNEQAKNALSQLPANWSGFVAHGVNTSPLHNKLLTHVTGVSPSG